MLVLRSPANMPDNTLVHICCAPDGTYGIRKISESYGRVTGFFYNPNIWPPEEYLKRLSETERLSSIMPFELIEGARNVDMFSEAFRGLENEPEKGDRCRICIYMRLEASAQMAKALEIDTFTTVLSVSPKKDVTMINDAGRDIAGKNGLFFIELDLKKRAGFAKSIALTREYRLYRQNYCGCKYSVRG